MMPEIAKYLPDEDIEIFEKIRKVVNDLPNIEFGSEGFGKITKLSCHILAEAVARVFELRRVDGWFTRSDHSWVVTKSRNIIDVYPVAILGGPILVCGNTVTAMLYERQEICADFFKSEAFKIAVRKVVEELNKFQKPAA